MSGVIGPMSTREEHRLHAIKLAVVVLLCVQNSLYSLLRRYSQVCTPHSFRFWSLIWWHVYDLSKLYFVVMVEKTLFELEVIIYEG